MELARVPPVIVVVRADMGPIDRGFAPPQTAFDAAQAAFEASYYTGDDELHAALNAAAPVIRMDESSGVREALYAALAGMTERDPLYVGLRRAQAILDARIGELVQEVTR